MVELAVGSDDSIRERKPPAALPNNRDSTLDFYGSAFFTSAPTVQRLLPEATKSQRAS